MLAPKKTKFRKAFKGKIHGLSKAGCLVSFGSFGLKALGTCRMTANQIEAARIAMNRCMRRAGTVWIRVFPHKPVTAKPAETRMGKGKGAFDRWVCPISPGRILFEIGGVNATLARKAMSLAAEKLPIPTCFVERQVLDHDLQQAYQAPPAPSQEG